MIAAVGGVLVLRSILTLLALSFTGPGGYWFVFWTDPLRRSIYITIAFALFVWLFVAAGWALSSQFGARRATGIVLAGVGAGLAIPAIVVGLVGLESALTLWNDEMGLLPWGLARILLARLLKSAVAAFLKGQSAKHACGARTCQKTGMILGELSIWQLTGVKCIFYRLPLGSKFEAV